MTPQKRWGLGIALLAATVTFWLAQWLNRDRERQLELPQARSDYTLESFDLLVMNEQGWPSFQVQSPHLEKNPGDRSVNIESPDLLLFDLGNPRWRVTAETGWISEDGKEILFGGAVEVVEQMHPPVTVRTRDLTINPDTYIARSAAAVNVERPGMKLAGRGFSADLKRRRYEILNDVEATYDALDN
ncbi:MAG: LPS export ABC transporter periplasmic protein LptC [Xanthomonadales bacterium]|nr:LPS export ABC transporter periplasmic protein LptC [Xanthomonadales bacterium]